MTAGYIGKLARPEFFAAMDAANIDLKAFTESFYKHFCTGSLDAVLDTLVRQTRELNIPPKAVEEVVPTYIGRSRAPERD